MKRAEQNAWHDVLYRMAGQRPSRRPCSCWARVPAPMSVPQRTWPAARHPREDGWLPTLTLYTSALVPVALKGEA